MRVQIPPPELVGYAGPAHLVNGRGEVWPVIVLGIAIVEPNSAADIEEGVYFIRVRGITADEASRYPWLVQD